MTGDPVPFPSWEAWNRIRGLLPPDRGLYEDQKALAAAHVRHVTCVICKERFSDANCFTQEGWQETQLSGLCERCFDQICLDAAAEEEEEMPEDNFANLGIRKSDFLP